MKFKRKHSRDLIFEKLNIIRFDVVRNVFLLQVKVKQHKKLSLIFQFPPKVREITNLYPFY